MNTDLKKKWTSARITAGLGISIVAIPVLSAGVIEEVVVTAEKRAESVQDVGLSVTAFDANALRRGGIEDVSRIDLLVPGVNFAFVGNDAKINVRGANASNTFADNSPVVGAFVDGVYKARASQQSRAFFDVERLEFLKGPQGTLYGRNTFAGALNLYTNAPNFEGVSGSISTSYERFNTSRLEGHVNVPVNDELALRVAGFFEDGDGYIDNNAGPDMGAPDDRGIRPLIVLMRCCASRGSRRQELRAACLATPIVAEMSPSRGSLIPLDRSRTARTRSAAPLADPTPTQLDPGRFPRISCRTLT